MDSLRISLLHPFTPGSVGLKEKMIPKYHSQPHALALNRLVIEKKYDCYIDYFTSRKFSYIKKHKSLKYRFFPVNYNLRGDHKKWKKQRSRSCLSAYTKSMPDVTIINMSGHSSDYSFELSKSILSKGKKYIPMLGGQHYTDNDRNRLYYKNADHILVHTSNQQREMMRLDLFKDLDIRVFPLGVDTQFFKPLANSKNLNHKRYPELLYVGRIVELKRIHIAIETLSALIKSGYKKARLKIIGPVSSKDYYNKLTKLVNDNNLMDNVEFIKEKSHIELIPFFQNTDLLMLPSSTETFGMVMIESMACGTPVAAIDCAGGPAEVIKHNYNGILTTLDNYSKSIIDYFQNLKLIESTKNNAMKTVNNNYSIENTYRVLVRSVNG